MLIGAQFVKKFVNHRSGSVGTLLAFMFPIVTMASLFAVDHVVVTQKQVSLQRAVDAAALTTVKGLRFVREGTVAHTTDEGGQQSNTTLSAIADSVVRNHLLSDETLGLLETSALRTDEDSVSVDATHTVETPFGSLTGLGDTTIQASAEAQLYGARNICIMALGDDQKVGVNFEQSARIEAGDCGIYSNSMAVASVNTIDSSYIESTFVCAAGGHTGGKSNVSTEVLTDCPQVSDPLASRPMPNAPFQCDHKWLVLGSEENRVLEPGHYCGGLIIEGDADIEMKPGIYFISGGKFIVKDRARVLGENVSVIMNDITGSIYFNDDASVTLSAPVDGPMAGIVIASHSRCGAKTLTSAFMKIIGEDCHQRVFEIKSAKVSSLLGTIYVPEDRFIVNTTMPVSEQAAFTIILARYVQGQRSPTLVLNTDYAATDVPVPDGFIGAEGSRLVN